MISKTDSFIVKIIFLDILVILPWEHQVWNLEISLTKGMPIEILHFKKIKIFWSFMKLKLLKNIGSLNIGSLTCHMGDYMDWFCYQLTQIWMVFDYTNLFNSFVGKMLNKTVFQCFDFIVTVDCLHYLMKIEFILYFY